MADTNATNSFLQLVVTTSQRIRDLVVKDGQFIFLRDIGRLAFDYKGQRVFYNQIVQLDTEAERLALEDPLDGYYFVIDTAMLWRYKDGWIQITDKPQEIVFIGTENDLPTLGQANKIYADVTSGEEHITVWSEELGRYVIVADKTQEVSDDDILKLFK